MSNENPKNSPKAPSKPKPTAKSSAGKPKTTKLSGATVREDF